MILYTLQYTTHWKMESQMDVLDESKDTQPHSDVGTITDVLGETERCRNVYRRRRVTQMV